MISPADAYELPPDEIWQRRTGIEGGVFDAGLLELQIQLPNAAIADICQIAGDESLLKALERLEIAVNSARIAVLLVTDRRSRDRLSTRISVGMSIGLEALASLIVLSAG